MFNPGANRVLGLIRRGWVPAPRKLQPYSVPALEMKRAWGVYISLKEGIATCRIRDLYFSTLCYIC